MATKPEMIDGTKWARCVDDKKRVFYANTETKAVQWDVPEEVKVAEEKMKEVTWVELFDPNSKKSYYCNLATKATVWQKPNSGKVLMRGQPGHPQYKPENALDKEVTEEKEVPKEEPVNELVKEEEEAASSTASSTSAEGPTETEKEVVDPVEAKEEPAAEEPAKEIEETAKQEDPEPEKAPAEKKEEELDPKWRAVYDEKNKNYYYVNIETRESTWNKSKALLVEEPPEAAAPSLELPPEMDAPTASDLPPDMPAEISGEFPDLPDEIPDLPPDAAPELSVEVPQEAKKSGKAKDNAKPHKMSAKERRQKTKSKDESDLMLGSPKPLDKDRSQKKKLKRGATSLGILEAAKKGSPKKTPSRVKTNPHKRNISQSLLMPMQGGQLGSPLRKSPSEQMMEERLSPKEQKEMKKAPKLKKDLAKEIHKFQIDGYAKNHFRNTKKGFFRREVGATKMMKYQKDMINNPLTKCEAKLAKQALNNFKSILEYCGEKDIKGKRTAQGIALEIINLGVQYNELRDEIFVQLTKQTNGNPNEQSCKKCWELMALASYSFPPSLDLENYLFKYLEVSGRNKDKTVSAFAIYSFKRLKRAVRRGTHGRAPLPEEIEHVSELPFLHNVFLMSLKEIMAHQTKTSKDKNIPEAVDALCSSILELGGATTEGIFRIPGDQDQIDRLKLNFEMGKYAIRTKSPNVPAGVLKLWLREVEEPLIPDEFYDSCIKACNDPKKILHTIGKLPNINKRVLIYLVSFLQKIAAHEKQNKMGVSNLAMVFAPNVLRCPSNNPTVILENSKFQQNFLENLIRHLEVKAK